MKRAATDTTTGFVGGILGGIKRIAAAGRRLAAALIRAVKDFLHIKSPSGVFEGIGSMVIAGLSRGLNFSNAMSMVKRFFGGVWGFASHVPSILSKLFSSGDVGSVFDALKNIDSLPGNLGRAILGLKAAYSKVGDQYLMGASGPNIFDCSGLASWLLEFMGFHFGRFTTATVSSIFAKGAGKFLSLGLNPHHMGIEILGKWFEARGRKWGVLGPGSSRTSWDRLFHITGFEKGGIVTTPTLAMIGERGPEAVVPLGKAGIGGTVQHFYNPHFTLPNVKDGKSFFEELGQMDHEFSITR